MPEYCCRVEGCPRARQPFRDAHTRNRHERRVHGREPLPRGGARKSRHPRRTAALRLFRAHPTATLAEIGQMMQPPITSQTVGALLKSSGAAAQGHRGKRTPSRCACGQPILGRQTACQQCAKGAPCAICGERVYYPRGATKPGPKSRAKNWHIACVQERDARIVGLAEAGKPLAEIAAEHGLSRQYVYQIIYRRRKAAQGKT